MTDARLIEADAALGDDERSDFWRKEACRARREEAQQQDRIHALEVQQAELLRQVKELTEALQEQRGTLPEQAWHSVRCMASGRASCTKDCAKVRSVLASATGMIP